MIGTRVNLRSSPRGRRPAQNNAMHSDGYSAALHSRPTEKVKQIPKSVHNAEIKDEECTQYQAKVREVGIREFRGNMAAELKSLPFKIIKNGKVIAVVSSA